MASGRETQATTRTVRPGQNSLNAVDENTLHRSGNLGIHYRQGIACYRSTALYFSLLAADARMNSSNILALGKLIEQLLVLVCNPLPRVSSLDSFRSAAPELLRQRRIVFD